MGSKRERETRTRGRQKDLERRRVRWENVDSERREEKPEGAGRWQTLPLQGGWQGSF